MPQAVDLSDFDLEEALSQPIEIPEEPEAQGAGPRFDADADLDDPGGETPWVPGIRAGRQPRQSRRPGFRSQAGSVDLSDFDLGVLDTPSPKAVAPASASRAGVDLSEFDLSGLDVGSNTVPQAEPTPAASLPGSVMDGYTPARTPPEAPSPAAGEVLRRKLPETFPTPPDGPQATPVDAYGPESFSLPQEPAGTRLEQGKEPTGTRLEQGREPSFWEGVQETLRRGTGVSRDRLANALALAEDLGVPPSQVVKNWDYYRTQAGLHPEPTTGQLAGGIMTLPIVAGMMTNPGATLLGLAAYEALGEAESYGISKALGEQYRLGLRKGLADLLPDETGDVGKGAAEIADFMAKAGILGAAHGKVPEAWKKVQASQWYRELTIPERSVVATDLANNLDGLLGLDPNSGQYIRRRLAALKEMFGADSPQYKSYYEEALYGSGRAGPPPQGPPGAGGTSGGGPTLGTPGARAEGAQAPAMDLSEFDLGPQPGSVSPGPARGASPSGRPPLDVPDIGDLIEEAPAIPLPPAATAPGAPSSAPEVNAGAAAYDVHRLNATSFSGSSQGNRLSPEQLGVFMNEMSAGQALARTLADLRGAGHGDLADKVQITSANAGEHAPHSLHYRGEAVDLNSKALSAQEQATIAAFAEKNGLVRDVAGEPWHFSYRGEKPAKPPSANKEVSHVPSQAVSGPQGDVGRLPVDTGAEDAVPAPAGAQGPFRAQTEPGQGDQAAQTQPRQELTDELAPAVDVAAHEAATSPQNDLPEPSEAQKEAGNYRKGHVRLQGLDISVENPAGSMRTGTAPDGTEWATEMANHYGYIKGTTGKDKDHLDVFLGPQAEASPWVFVVNQVDPATGKFDEHKVMLGFDSPEAARAAYLANYEAGWQGLGSMASMDMPGFKGWLKNGDMWQPARTRKPVRQPAPAEGSGPGQALRFQRTWQGSPTRGIERMDDAYLGTGEGRRSETNNDYSGGYGWGHYSAQNRETAEWYREELSREKASPQARDLKNALQEVDYLGFDTASQAATAIDKHPDWAKRWDVLPEEKSRIEAALRNFNEAKKGQLYQLAIPDPDKLLDWHKPLNEQPESVKEKLKQASLYQENAYPTIERSDSGKTWWVKGPGGWEPAGAPRFRSLEKAQQWLRENRETFAFKPTGELLYRKLATSKGGQKAASQYLDSIGIPGHQYLDAGSRGASKGTHNVVTYSDRHIDITGRFRRRQAPGVAGFGDVATVRQALAPGLEQYPAVARLVDVFATEGDMPPALRRSIEAAGMSRRFYAVYDPESGRIAFVAANIPSARAAQAGFLKMLLHHEGRHAGLSFVFGSEAAKLDWMGRAAATLPREVAAWLRKHKRPDTAANRAEAAEEILVDWAAAGKVHNWVDRLLARIAAWIRKFFPKLRLTRAEMRDLLARVDDWLTGKGPRFVGEREASRGSREVAPAFSREETRGLPERVRIVALPSERFPARHIAELRKEARKWALKHLPGSYRNDHTGWDIEITRRRIDKQTSQRENPLHYETLRVLPQIIKEAVLAESAPDRSNDPYIKAVHRLYAPLRAEGEIYRVKLTVKEYTDGRKLYDHSLTEMEKPARPVRDMPDGQRIDEPATGSPAPGHEGQDDISVRQLLDGVKGGDIRMARAEPQRLYGVTDGKVRALAEADGEGVTVHFAEGDSLREGAYRTEAFPDMAAARKAMADAGLTIMRQAVSGRAERQPGRARESGQGGGSFGSVPPATAPAQEKASQGAGGGNGATEGGKAAADEGPQALRLEMPELVRLARGLLGRYPAVLEKLYGRRLGSFHPRQGQSQIKLKADIFIGPKLAEAEFKTPAEAEAFVHEVLQKHGLAWDDAHVVTAKTPKGQAVSVYRVDPDYAAMVLAHEIGHLIDYLPDHELRRGNILGHVAGLKKYLKHWLANRPGGEGPLTPKDRLRLMSVARRMTAGRQYEIQVEEEIVKTLGVTPEDILGIWNDVAGRDKVSPKLYDYIAGLSSAEKKSILREAMRGLVAKELERFGRTVREKTGRMLTKIVAEPTRDAAVQAKYRDLVREEIEKRRLFSRDDLKEELKTLSRWWSPFDPAADAQYTAYRYGNEELYADALSALLNSPYEVKARAPGFYEAFFNWLGEKPEVKALYDAIQEDIRSGEYKTDRVKRLHQMFRKADEAYREKYEKKLEYGRPIKAALVNRHAPVFAALTDKRVRFLVEKAVYTGSQREGYLREVFTKVTKVLEKAGLELEDFGEYLFHKRVQGERSKMANPQGWTAKASGERLEEMRDASFTPDQARKLEKARKDFLAIRREWVIAEMEKADMFAPELMKAISEAEDYATFDVFSHSLEEGYGRGVGAAIHRQIGTVNEITNPFTATVMKDLSVLAAVNWNTAKRGVLEDLLAGKPGRIEPAKRVWNGKRLAPVEPKAADQGMVVYLDRGELKAFYVDRMVADAFDQQTAEEVSALGRLLQHVANPFRLVFTQFNPGFQMYNVIKDFRSALINLPGANPEVRFLREYVKALVPAFQSAFGLPPETVKEMEKAGMFVSVANPMGVEREDVQMRRLEQMYGLRPKEWELHVWRPMDALFNWVAHGAMRAANFAFNLSGALERVPKIAGYTYLKRYFPGRSEYELAHMVRSWAGSPAFLNKGTAHAITNNLILFSNAFVQGNVASLEAMRANPKQYWWKWAKWSLVPKLLMWGAALGAFGEAMRQVMDGVGEYDKTNYLIIPLGQTQNKKSVVLRLPLDEFSRLTGGILWKTLQFVRTGDADGLNSLADFMAGQVPSLNPAFSVGTNVWSYLSGHNPYDMFRQRPIMDETTFRAGGTAAAKAMGKYVWNTVGGGVVYVFRNDDAIDVKKELFEQVVQAPFLANTLGRFVKVTDLGVREQLTAAKGEPQQSRARTILAVRSAMARLVNGDPLTQEELGLLAQERDYLRRNMPQALMRREGSALWDALMRAATKEEKIAILRKWQEMGRAANDR